MQLRADLAGIGALVLLLALVWGAVAFTEQTFYFRDLSFFYTPLYVEAGRQLLSGVFPEWNPHLGGGAPLAADPNVGIFFPDVLLLPLLGAGPSAVEALLIFRLLALAVAAYAALRLLPLPRMAAFLGAAVVSLSGPVSSSLTSFPHHLAGAILLLPLAVCGFRLANRRPVVAVAGPLLMALLVFAGSPELAVQGGVLFALCALGRPIAQTLPRIFGALLLGGLLAAPQILPALELFPRTPRGQGLRLATAPGFLSFPPARLVELVWPGFFGDAGGDAFHDFWGRAFSSGAKPYLLSVAIGLVPLALLPFAWRDPFGRRLLAAAGLFLLLAFGRFLPLGERLLALPPLSAFRFPEKWMIGATLALAGASAAGLEAWRRQSPGRGSLVLAGSIAVLSLLLGGLSLAAPETLLSALRERGLVETGFPAGLEPAVARTLAREAAVALAISGVLFFLLTRRRASAALSLAVVVLAVAERLPRAAGVTPTTSIDLFTKPWPTTKLAVLEANAGRLFFDREATTSLDQLRPFTGTIFGFSYAGNTDVDHFSDVRSRAFSETLQKLDFSDPRKAGLLRLSNVTVVSTNDPLARSASGLRRRASLPDGRELYAVLGAAPGRLYFEAAPARDRSQALRYTLARGLPLEDVAVVEGSGPMRGRTTTGRVTVTQPRPGAIRARASAPAEAILQLATTHDPNWRLRVDGRPAPALVVDSVFLGVRLPAGEHVVEAEYRDGSFVLGAAVALAVLGGLLAYALVSRNRRGAASDAA